MPGIGTSGLMSGDWKRSEGPSQDRWQPRQSSTLQREPVRVVNAAIIGHFSVCTIRFDGFLTRFADRASDNFRLPVIRVRQGAGQQADE